MRRCVSTLTELSEPLLCRASRKEINDLKHE
jgi:hypothetical protein